MSLSANKSRLATISKELSIHWQHTKERWPDLKSQEFERKYVEELLTSVDAALSVIDQMDKLAAKIRRRARRS